MNNFKLDSRTIGIGILIVIAALIFLPRLLNNGSDTTPNEPETTERRDDTSNVDIELGNPVAAAAVDSDGCAVNVTSDFESSEDIYIVAPDSYIPEGTSVFVRLYHENTAVEDAQEIVADRDYENTCINFVFEPVGAPFDEGDYTAEFYVNGNMAESVDFEIR